MIASPELNSALEDPAGDFARNYNRRSFLFEHGLANHPLFAIPELVALSQRLPDGGASAYWSNGRVRVNDTWETNQAARYSLSDTIANVADNDSLVILKHVNDDPQYGVVLNAFLARVVELSGLEMQRDVIVGEALVLVSSPNRVTSYHIDGETNFVVQVVGDKSFHVHDPRDRNVLTETELERYYSGDVSAASYKAERDVDAMSYDLRAGYGVHVPLTAPHWAEVRDDVSVALSITYEIRSAARLAAVYQFNQRMREFGLSPAAPGKSALRDGAKTALIRGVRGARRLLGSRAAVGG